MNVVITNVDLQGEVVTVRNDGTGAVNMTGWKIVSTVGNQTFTFPAGYTLSAGGTVRVTSGPSAVSNPPGYLKWSGAYIWNNDGDPAELRDAAGSVVSRYP